jgi:hypothetical protein
MNIYFIRDSEEQKRLSVIPWLGLSLHKMLNIDCLCSTYQVREMTKKEYKKYGMRKINRAEFDPLVMVCMDLVE